MVGGSIVFTFSALTLVALWTPCKEDDICVLCLFPLVTFIMFCINIWGATVVFGKLKPLLNANQNFKKKAPLKMNLFCLLNAQSVLDLSHGFDICLLSKRQTSKP